MGDLRPHNAGWEQLEEVVKLLQKREANYNASELIDLSYPVPFNTKTHLYYWLIKYELRAISENIEGLVVRIEGKENLQHAIGSHIVYAQRLRAKARIYSLQLDQSAEAYLTSPDSYIAYFCHISLGIFLDELLPYYSQLDLIPAELLKAHFIPKTEQAEEVLRRLELFVNRKKQSATELFSLCVPEGQHGELLFRLYQYLKSTNRIDIAASKFERHFQLTKEEFEKLKWKAGVPYLKHIFVHLINRGIVNRPSTNLDLLLSLHFVNKKGQDIDPNYLSQSLSSSRMPATGSKAKSLYRELDDTLSNFFSN